MEFVDIGANLCHASFASDLEDVLGRAAGAGVTRLIVTGTSVSDSRAAAELARRHPRRLRATAGIHPHEAAAFDPAAEVEIEALARRGEVAAIGETGLDFHRDFSPRSDQERAFEAHLDLAARLGLPVFMHERDAHRRFLEILAPFRGRLGPAVIHCFTGDRDALHACLDLDLHVGITGWICDERRGLHLRPLVGEIPSDRLMLETDAPYLLPRDLRPRPRTRRNEPRWLPHVARAVAAAAGETVEEVAARTTATACAFFGLPLLACTEGGTQAGIEDGPRDGGSARAAAGKQGGDDGGLCAAAGPRAGLRAG